MATAIQEIHMNDSGLNFIDTIMDADGIVDLSSSTLRQFLFQKPDGTMLIVTATFATDGTDGKIQYVTGPDDFDQSGTWRHQAYVEIGPDQKWSNVTKFKVFPNLPLSL